MILRMTTVTFTAVHVTLSLIGIVAACLLCTAEPMQALREGRAA